MSRKDVEIISLLMSRSDYTSFNDVRLAFNISERGARYEVEKANDLLKELDLPQIEQNRRFGLKLVFTESQKNTVKNYMEKMKKELICYNSNERFSFIIFSILNESVNAFGNKLAISLNVSKSTIDSDMKKIRAYVGKYGLAIHSLPKEGFKLIGNEWDIRMMLNNLINKSDASKILDISNANRINKIERIVIDFLSEELLLWVYAQFKKFNSLSNYNISDVHCKQLTIIFTIWLKRISKEYVLENENLIASCHGKLHEYEIVKLFTQDVQETYDVQIDVCETYYLYYLLDGFNIQEDVSLTENWGGIQIITLQFIEQMELLTSISFSKDKGLFEKLYHHITALLKRLKKKVSISNPLTHMVTEYYPDIFNTSKSAIEVIERYSGNPISDDEISYLAIHFSASKEKLTQYNNRRYRVVVICGHGVATGNLLAENLRKFYQFDIVGIVNNDDIKVIKRLNVDFAFSTINSEIDNLPVLTIDPFLGDYDRKKINKFLQEYVQTENTHVSRFNSVEVFKEICMIAQRNCVKMNMDDFVNDLTDLLEKNRLQIDKGGMQPMISEILTDKQILLKKEINHWEESIRIVAQPLLEDDYINESYVEAMIDAVKEYGAYIVIGKGIALAHARPEAGVNKLGLSVLTLATPIAFGHKDNDPVKIIFCLATTNNISHLKIMKTVVRLVNEERKLNKLIEQHTIRGFKQVISEIEVEG